jgi:hypothetical protein
LREQVQDEQLQQTPCIKTIPLYRCPARSKPKGRSVDEGTYQLNFMQGLAATGVSSEVRIRKGQQQQQGQETTWA